MYINLISVEMYLQHRSAGTSSYTTFPQHWLEFFQTSTSPMCFSWWKPFVFCLATACQMKTLPMLRSYSTHSGNFMSSIMVCNMISLVDVLSTNFSSLDRSCSLHHKRAPAFTHAIFCEAVWTFVDSLSVSFWGIHGPPPWTDSLYPWHCQSGC